MQVEIYCIVQHSLSFEIKLNHINSFSVCFIGYSARTHLDVGINLDFSNYNPCRLTMNSDNFNTKSFGTNVRNEESLHFFLISSRAITSKSY